MKFKDSNTLLKLKFLNEHMEEIKAEHAKHRAEKGYVLISADNQYELVEPPHFIRREFEEASFISVNEGVPVAGCETPNTGWLYYEAFWGHDWTTWRLKEIFNPPLHLP